MNVGAAQIRLSSRIPKNLEKIAAYVRKATRRRLDLVVFPECALTGYLPSTKAKPPRPEDVREGIQEVASMARAARTAVIFGSTVPVRGGLYNRALAVSKAGRIVSAYDKVHLTPGDTRVYRKGSGLPVFRMDRTPFGMQICFDIRFPEPWLALAHRGVRVVAHIVHMDVKSTGWKKPVIQAHVQSRAGENGIYVISANVAYSPVNHLSMIADPDGLLLARASSGKEQLVCAEIDPRRATHGWLKHRRADLFGNPRPRPRR